MAQQNIFPPAQTINASYDWIDLVSASGFILFDGFAAHPSAGLSYHLIEESHAADIINTVHLNLWTTGTAIDNAAFTESINLDFDTSIFQLPRTIEGTGFINIPFYVTFNPTTGQVKVKVRIIKLLVTAETELVKDDSTTLTVSAAGEGSWTVPLTIPKTLIKKGEQLRINIIGYVKTTAGAGNIQLNLGHNPRNTTVATGFNAGNTRMSAAIPFKLDFM